MLRVETTNENNIAYGDWIGTQGDRVVRASPIPRFNPKKEELFLTVVNNHCYRSGIEEVYGVRRGKVYFIDDLNNEEVLVMDYTKDEFLAKIKEIFAC